MKKFIAFIILFTTINNMIYAQSKEETEVANAAEQLRLAMVSGDSTKLADIVSDKLIYGHSAGHIDNKAEFVEKIVSGKSKFLTINISEQTISISGNTAIVHQKFDATTSDDGKPGEVHLLVLLVWQNQHHHWILLARQAVHPA
jgi:ketosteroid isomerase-like protein